MKTPVLAPALALLFALLAAPHAEAACTFTLKETNFDSGDEHYMSRWQCQQAYVDYFWDAYDFDEGNWDEGFGYSDPCNLNLPLARTFNALVALHYSTSSQSWNGPILNWGGLYASTYIDELDGMCSSGSTVARTYVGGIDDFTNLYRSFFYNFSVPERAAIILHEARHAGGSSHSSNPTCALNPSCDPYWEWYGANTYEVSWLWQYAYNAIGTTEALKLRAQDGANIVLRMGFNTDPGFVIANPALEGAVAVASWWPGRMDAFKLNSSGNLLHKYYQNGWSGGWTNLGGSLLGAPAAVSWDLNRIDIVARATDNAIWHNCWYGSGWCGWSPLGTPPGVTFKSAPAISSWGQNRLDVFGRGSDNQLWHRAYTGVWSSWLPLGAPAGGLTSGPAAVSWGYNRIDFVAKGADHAVWHNCWSVNNWCGWSSLGTPAGVAFDSAPAIASWDVNRLDIVGRGRDGALWHRAWANGWYGWGSLGGAHASGPGAVSWGPNRLDVFSKNTEGNVQQRTWNGSTWSSWKAIEGRGVECAPTSPPDCGRSY